MSKCIRICVCVCVYIKLTCEFARVYLKECHFLRRDGPDRVVC